MAGRLRVRLAALRLNEAAARGCVEAIRSVSGVTGVRWNPDCASLLVSWVGPGEIGCCVLAVIRGGSVRRWGERARRDASPGESVAAAARAEAERRGLGIAAGALALALWGGPVGTAVSIPLLFWNAVPTWRNAWRVLAHERRLNVDFLDGLAIVIGLAQADFVTTGVMIALIRLGDWIRERTAGRTRRAVGDLLDYQGRQAWLLRGGRVVRVRADLLQPGDFVVVHPGEIIPADGEVQKGAAIVDQKTITGESLPVRRAAGEFVYAATVLREGKLVVRAVRVGSETAAARIVQLVESAPIGETRIQNYAEKFADRLVAPQLGLNCGLLLLTGSVTRFLSMTIVDYGTGMRVAAPTAVLASITHAARQGIVIRSGRHVEKLAGAQTIVFDKTGTLTTGSPEVLGVVAYRSRSFPEDKVLGLAASAEARLTHPVASAVTSKARERGVAIPDHTDSHYKIGMGVSAQVNGYRVHVGNERFLDHQGISFAKARRDLARIGSDGLSSLLVAVDDHLIGLIPYSDRVRPESADVIRAIQRGGRAETVMLTGDNSTVARAVAAQLGIRRFVADMMPTDKAEVVRELQRGGHVVAMVGDGINDSPALAYADIGIAMKNGADVAQESADVVLMEDNLWKHVQAIQISRKAMSLIRQNYLLIAGLNTLALALALPAGLVSPNVTALISNGSAILAAVNAIRPILRY